MIKYYKNLTDTTLNLTLFGLGKVHIPADAKCIPLDHVVAEAVMNMTSLPVLEEVTPEIEDASEVLVTKDEEEEGNAAPSPFQEMTLEEMRAYCTEHNIEFSKSAGREVMLKKLINL